MLHVHRSDYDWFPHSAQLTSGGIKGEMAKVKLSKFATCHFSVHRLLPTAALADF